MIIIDSNRQGRGDEKRRTIAYMRRRYYEFKNIPSPLSRPPVDSTVDIDSDEDVAVKRQNIVPIERLQETTPFRVTILKINAHKFKKRRRAAAQSSRDPLTIKSSSGLKGSADDSGPKAMHGH